MPPIPPASGAVVVALGIVVLATVGRGLVRTRRAARRTDGRHEPATGLDRRFAQLHHELLRARTELRVALDMPVDTPLDLRDGPPADPDPASIRSRRGDSRSIAVARHRAHRLWRDGAELLGSAQDPIWHVRGRLDWVRLGRGGRQVLTVRATLGHDPGRWVTVRAVRRTRRAAPALGGGGSPLRATIRAADPSGVVRAVALAVAEPVARPSLGRPRRLPPRTLRRLRDRLPARWELVSVEVLGTSGPWAAAGRHADHAHAPGMGRAARSVMTSRPSAGPLLNPGPERPDHPGRKR